MKIITTYQCEVCRDIYKTAAEAERCQSTPVRESKGVKIGDEVLITGGDGKGLRCKVDEINVIGPSWGPSRYSHTEYVNGKVVDSWGSRMLTFDQYEVTSQRTNPSL